MIKKTVRSILYRLIKWSGVHEDIDLMIQSLKKDFHSVAAYDKAFFYQSSRLLNLQGDKNKIIIGDHTHVCGELLVFKYGGQISVGENSYIGDHSRIWSGESVYIGSNVLISHNVNIMDTNAHETDAVERAESYRQQQLSGLSAVKGSVITAPVRINDYAWIGFNSSILKGVTIGEGAIVAAGSVVTQSVPDYTMVAGNPARIIKTLKA